MGKNKHGKTYEKTDYWFNMDSENPEAISTKNKMTDVASVEDQYKHLQDHQKKFCNAVNAS